MCLSDPIQYFSFLKSSQFKLADFGMATGLDSFGYCEGRCGTLTHMAPEILKEMPYGCKVDVWALGVTIFQLVCGYLPFSGRSVEDI